MNNYFKKIYKNKKVLITGHTGFKGSWLTLWLTELGADVVGYSLDPPTKPNLFEILELDKKIKHYTGNINNIKKLFDVFDKEKPEFVFHLAAQPLVRLSYKEPKNTYETNVIGTINVLEAIKKTKTVKCCIVITSDKCYENKELDYSYKETDRLGGYDPYSSSKACAERVTSAYRQSFFNPNEYKIKHDVVLSSVRAGNVIGGGDWGEDRLIPDCITSLSSNKEIIIRNPNAIRPWQYVLEPLSGYLLLGAKMYEKGIIYSGCWNFGPMDKNIITVEDIVKQIIINWGCGKYKLDRDEHPHEASLLKLDISKASELLNWKPIFNLEETIKMTVDWYKLYYDGKNKQNISRFMLNYINKYD